MWTPLRQEIEQVRRQLHLSESDFRSISQFEWAAMEEKTYQRFCRINHPRARSIWLWDQLKNDKIVAALNCASWPEQHLTALIDANELVLLFVNSSHRFWWYEGNMKAIYQILEECTQLDEVNVVSKKYEWLLCCTHHDVLVGCGETIVEKMEVLAHNLGQSQNLRIYAPAIARPAR